MPEPPEGESKESPVPFGPQPTSEHSLQNLSKPKCCSLRHAKAACLLGAEGHNRFRFSDSAARGSCSRVLAAHQSEQRDNGKEHTRHRRILREKMERPRHRETEIAEAAQGESI
jgi:hypothetical protein